jgi:hypothetical protein
LEDPSLRGYPETPKIANGSKRAHVQIDPFISPSQVSSKDFRA